MSQRIKIAKLFVCASCEWIFKVKSKDGGCPMCEFGYYSAHYVYGKKAYTYHRTQKPWKDRLLSNYSYELDTKIAQCNDYNYKQGISL